MPRRRLDASVRSRDLLWRHLERNQIAIARRTPPLFRLRFGPLYRGGRVLLHASAMCVKASEGVLGERRALAIYI